MTNLSVVVEAKRQRTSGCALMRLTRLRNARRPMSTESLARSATETRMIKALVPCRSSPSVRLSRTIAKGGDMANMPARNAD